MPVKVSFWVLIFVLNLLTHYLHWNLKRQTTGCFFKNVIVDKAINNDLVQNCKIYTPVLNCKHLKQYYNSAVRRLNRLEYACGKPLKFCCCSQPMLTVFSSIRVPLQRSLVTPSRQTILHTDNTVTRLLKSE